jgi:hypothetical protein
LLASSSAVDQYAVWSPVGKMSVTATSPMANRPGSPWAMLEKAAPPSARIWSSMSVGNTGPTGAAMGQAAAGKVAVSPVLCALR